MLENNSQIVSPETHAQFLSVLKNAGDTPSDFASFMELWNRLCDIDKRSGTVAFSDIGDISFAGMPAVDGQSKHDHSERRVSQMLDHFEHPSFLVGGNGRITVQNNVALSRFDVSVGDAINALPMDLEADEPLTKFIATCLHQDASEQQTMLRRAYGSDGVHVATLAGTPATVSQDGQPQVLIFVISARWIIAAPDLIRHQYDLTRTETSLLGNFLEGLSIEDMAAARGRSVATVRTQFYNLIAKMKVSNQTDLLRLALSVVQFHDQIEGITKQIRHPFRKRLDVIRPGGRSVQVTLAGDFAGSPVVALSSCLTYTFAPHIEASFRAAEFCAISICRPGFGDTDPPVDGVDDLATFADDLRAVLDQLGQAKCMILATNTTSPIMFQFAPHLADRISALVQLSGCIPTPYVKQRKSSSTWVQGAIQAAIQQPLLKTFMVRSGVRAWRAMGQKRFLKMQFSKHPDELERVLAPDILEETQTALEHATKQGYERATQDLLAAFADFTPDIAACPLPVLILHGDQNLVYPISAARDLAHDFPGVTLVEFKGAGFTLMATHIASVLDQMKTFSAACEPVTLTG